MNKNTNKKGGRKYLTKYDRNNILNIEIIK